MQKAVTHLEKRNKKLSQVKRIYQNQTVYLRLKGKRRKRKDLDLALKMKI